MKPGIWLLLFLPFLFSKLSVSTTGYLSDINSKAHRYEENEKVLRTTASPVGKVKLVVIKSKYELQVFDDKGWYATYPVVFGNNSLGDKRMEGDKNTPEGTFKIVSKRVHNKWHRFLHIDYPNQHSKEKFALRKQKGEIPANARIGGAIGIHGTWPRDEMVVDKYQNWTDGCISMKNSEVQELYDYTPVGTEITIKR